MPATKRTRKDGDAPVEAPKPPPTRRKAPHSAWATGWSILSMGLP